MDESCFIKPTAYMEVVPMLQTDQGHMVLTSSHKSSSDSRGFVDMHLLRGREILINNMSFVCPNHVSAMLQENTCTTCCPCYLFGQPPHLTVDLNYGRVMGAFARASTSGSGKASLVGRGNESKEALLSEIGILPQMQDISALAQSTNTKHTLATKKAGEKFCSNLVPVREYVVTRERKDMVFDEKVCVYIDPAPTDVGRSLHAMCFVAKAERVNPAPNKARSCYVVLAVEEFNTADVDGKSEDGMLALSVAFVKTCTVLTYQYQAFFTTYIVAPEANSVSVGPFWHKCATLFFATPLLVENDISVLATTIPMPATTTTYRNKSRSSRKKKERAHPYRLPTPASQILANSNSTDAFLSRCTGDVPSYPSGGGSGVSYRVGYALGGDKVTRIYNFFVSLYNPVSGNVAEVLCAEYVWSFWVGNKTQSIPLYIVRALEELELIPKWVGNRKVLKIGGKKSASDGQFVQDDLAIAIVMSICMCEDILVTRVYRNELVRLENKPQQGDKSVNGNCVYLTDDTLLTSVE